MPFVTFNVILPFALPQVASVGVALAVGTVVVLTVVDAVAVQPLTSVTVNE